MIATWIVRPPAQQLKADGEPLLSFDTYGIKYIGSKRKMFRKRIKRTKNF